MTTKTFALAIAIALFGCSTHAQTQPPLAPNAKKQAAKAVDTKKVKPEPAAEVVPPQPAPPPPPPPFSPVVYKEGVPVTDYLVNEPQKVYEWIQGQLTSVAGKPDQYSTSEEKQKYETAVRERMSTLGQLPIPSICARKYDADAQAFEVKTLLSSIKDIMLENPKPEAIKLRKMVLGRLNQTTETYKGQNAYGASVDVSKTSSDEYAFSFPAGSEPSGVIVPGNTASSFATPYRYTFNFLVLSVKMPPAVARDSEKQISCLSVLTLDPPYIFKFRERDTPTRDLPYDRTVNGYSMFGKLERVLVFNKASGEIYTQAAR